MTIFEFVEEISDIIGGENAYYRFEKEELIEMCKEMSESHKKIEEFKEYHFTEDEIAGAA